MLPRPVVVLVGVAATVVTAIGLQHLAWLVAPFFLAMVIVILIHPLHGWLRRRRVPEGVALALLLLGIYGVIIALVAIMVLSVARLASILPQYAGDVAGLVQSLSARLGGWGVDPQQVRALVSSLDVRRVVSALTTLLQAVAGVGANVAFLLSLLLFLGIESTGAGSRMAVITAARPHLGVAIGNVITNTRRFLAVTAIFGLITGFADTLLLLWLGIPLAALWGLLAAICNFIPYVGFIIGLVPPALLALLGGDWKEMLLVIVTYIVLNSVFTSLIAPHFVGDAVGISITVTMIAVVFWSWVLGPLGAVLAIPLTLLTKGLLIDADPDAAWANAVVGSGKTPSVEEVPSAAPPSETENSPAPGEPALEQPAAKSPMLDFP